MRFGKVYSLREKQLDGTRYVAKITCVEDLLADNFVPDSQKTKMKELWIEKMRQEQEIARKYSGNAGFIVNQTGKAIVFGLLCGQCRVVNRHRLNLPLRCISTCKITYHIMPTILVMQAVTIVDNKASTGKFYRKGHRRRMGMDVTT